MGHTKKVGTAGRFGSRYGRGIRKRIVKVETRQKTLVACPSCGFKKIKREAAGLYLCGKCGVKFTGGAYEAETLTGKTIKKMVAQKSFAATELQDLQKESSYADIEKAVEKAMDAGIGEEISIEPVEAKTKRKVKTKKPKVKEKLEANLEKDLEEAEEGKE